MRLVAARLKPGPFKEPFMKGANYKALRPTFRLRSRSVRSSPSSFPPKPRSRGMLCLNLVEFLNEAAMPRYEYRVLSPTPAAEKTFLAWIDRLDQEFMNRDPEHRSDVVRNVLHELYL